MLLFFFSNSHSLQILLLAGRLVCCSYSPLQCELREKCNDIYLEPRFSWWCRRRTRIIKSRQDKISIKLESKLIGSQLYCNLLKGFLVSQLSLMNGKTNKIWACFNEGCRIKMTQLKIPSNFRFSSLSESWQFEWKQGKVVGGGGEYSFENH